MDLITVRDGPSLVPATRYDLDELEKVRERHPLRTTITFARSLKHWRWFNGLVQTVAEGIGMHRDQLYVALKVKAGFIRQAVMVRGIGTAIEPQSFSFAAADEIKFTEFRRIAVEILFTDPDYLPNVKRDDVYQKVEDIMHEPCPWA